MANEVTITVTSKIIGRKWALSPYNPTDGVIGAPEYLVPTYIMKVSGVSSHFKVIRFGIKRTNLNPPPKTRICDVGLFKNNIYTATWIPTYTVHSGPGSVPGAWQIYKNFLIHEGSSNPSDAWGTYGCVEVVGAGEWSRFIKSVKKTGGAENIILSKQKLVKINIEKAAAPIATLI
jgi:hypothetical protein